MFRKFLFFIFFFSNNKMPIKKIQRRRKAPVPQRPRARRAVRGKARRGNFVRKPPGGRMGQLPKGQASQIRAKLLDVLTVPNVYSQQWGDQCVVPASSSTLGIQCNYFNMNQNSQPMGFNNPFIMQKIAGAITTAANQTIKFNLTDFRLTHSITNQSNVFIKIIGYLCELREDLSNEGTSNYPLYLLGQGFGNSGLDSTHPNIVNQGINRMDLSPFNSPDFCQAFKIVKVKTCKVVPGGVCHYSLKHSKPISVRPNRWLSFVSGSTYATAVLDYLNARKEQFWFFRVETDMLGNNSVTSTNLMDQTYRVNMLTNAHWEYKYIQDTQPVISAQPAINIAVAAGTTNIMNRYTGAAIAETTA